LQAVVTNISFRHQLRYLLASSMMSLPPDKQKDRVLIERRSWKG